MEVDGEIAQHKKRPFKTRTQNSGYQGYDPYWVQ